MNANDLRLPPQAIDAERSVIGGLLLGGEAAWDKVSDLISDADFYLDAHRRIFKHVRRLAETGKPVDLLTVSDAIDAANDGKQTGGLAYLGEIAASSAGAANIAWYANAVVERSRLRRLIAASVSVTEIATKSGGEPAQERIDQATELLMALTESGAPKDEPVEIGVVIGAVIEQIDERFQAGGEISGLRTGFYDLDAKMDGMKDGDLIIVAGRPSMGKTAFALNIAENVALDGKPVMVFSMEMSREQLVTRSLSSLGGIDGTRLAAGRLDGDEWTLLTAAVAKLHRAPLVIDHSPALTASRMHSRARKQKRKGGLGLVVIDYLQLMSGNGNNRNEELSAITRALKVMARDLSVPVICLSQLSRQVESRPNKRPIMSDLRESGAIEQDADVVLMLYRDEYYNPESAYKGIAEVLVRKNRMGPMGGDVRMVFQPEFSRFRTVDKAMLAAIDQRERISAKPSARRRGFAED